MPNGKGSFVWTFDFDAKAWERPEPAGGKPPVALGDSCYIPELDACFMIFAEKRGGPETNCFYHVEKRKWFTSPYVGKAIFSKTTGRDASPFWDPELKCIVRVAHESREAWVDVLVMRLDPKTLELTEVK